MKIGTVVKSKTLIEEDYEGVVIGTATSNVLLSLTKQMSYDAAVAMYEALESYSETFKGHYAHLALVEYGDYVTSKRTGRTDHAFWIPIADLEVIEESKL